jgi:hypothetical protein
MIDIVLPLSGIFLALPACLIKDMPIFFCKCLLMLFLFIFVLDNLRLFNN